MLRQVAILGIGQTKIDEHWDLSLREIGGNAAFAAMQDAGVEKVDALFVGNMLSPLVSGQNQLGTFFSDWVGLWHQESVKVEAAFLDSSAETVFGDHNRATRIVFEPGPLRFLIASPARVGLPEPGRDKCRTANPNSKAFKKLRSVLNLGIGFWAKIR